LANRFGHIQKSVLFFPGHAAISRQFGFKIEGAEKLDTPCLISTDVFGIFAIEERMQKAEEQESDESLYAR
jgi:hypothetical protein